MYFRPAQQFDYQGTYNSKEIELVRMQYIVLVYSITKSVLQLYGQDNANKWE